MSMYVELFHGRNTINEPMDDWGTSGPIFKASNVDCIGFHMTYAADIKFDNCYLKIVDDCVYYNGVYYGDWSFLDDACFHCDKSHKLRLVDWEEDKARPPEPIKPVIERSWYAKVVDTVCGLCRAFVSFLGNFC